jgi:hypothetical protein
MPFSQFDKLTAGFDRLRANGGSLENLEDFSFPGSAWERKGRAALPLQECPQTGRACQAGRARAEPGHEGKSKGRKITFSSPS